MNHPVRGLVTRFVEGFFILLPILIAYLMLGQLFDMLMALTQPILEAIQRDLYQAADFNQFRAAVRSLTRFEHVDLQRTSEQLAHQKRSVPFRLEDATGSLSVDPEGASFTAEKALSRTEPAGSGPRQPPGSPINHEQQYGRQDTLPRLPR